MCVSLTLECAFSTRSSPTLECSSPARTRSCQAPKVLVPSTKRAFVASVKHDCLQCDSYLEVSSKDYISSIAMNAFVCSVKSYSEVSSID